MRAALVNQSNSLVENLIEVPADWQAPAGFLLVPSADADFGWRWNGSVLVAPPPLPPPPPPPKRIAIADLVALLVAKGHLTVADIAAIQK